MDAPEKQSAEESPMQPHDGDRSDAFSILAHDVKTPITSIRMTLHMLLEEKIGTLNADQRELVEAAREDCEHMLTTIPSLLELARFQNNCVKPKLQPTPPETLLKEAESKHGGHPNGKGLPVSIQQPPKGLPLVQADAGLVGRVLEALIHNAAKAGPAGSPVMLSAAVRDEFVRLFVRCRTGRPQAASAETVALESRKGRTREEGPFGLKICSEIARVHGGRIGFGSGGEFEEFYIDLVRSP